MKAGVIQIRALSLQRSAAQPASPLSFPSTNHKPSPSPAEQSSSFPQPQRTRQLQTHPSICQAHADPPVITRALTGPLLSARPNGSRLNSPCLCLGWGVNRVALYLAANFHNSERNAVSLRPSSLHSNLHEIS